MGNKNKAYLYGAAVQGIQSFIFQTNELKDIVGASELVNAICQSKYNAKKQPVFSEGLFDEFGNNPEDSILRAAGNIKYLFKEKSACQKAVREFPKKVMETAPGITISQAVVEIEYSDDNDFNTQYETASQELEMKLRAQRNKPFDSITAGPLACSRSRKTGLPEVPFTSIKDPDKEEHFDKATIQKRRYIKQVDLINKAFYREGESEYRLTEDDVALNISEMTDSNSWIAIIHADGNSLGKLVEKVGKEKEQFKKFSAALDKSTQEAAYDAFQVVKKTYLDDSYKIPMRPIVLGGDDLTMVMRGSLAIPFVEAFLKAFEERTKLNLNEILKNEPDLEFDRLTACAGIAFVKESYPFYYGYQLAEELCSAAKKDAKKDERLRKGGLAPSCLMFHKVQDSFVTNYNDIVERELKPQDDLSFQFGPYYLELNDTFENVTIQKKDGSTKINFANKVSKANRWTIEDLNKSVKSLKDKDGNALKSNLREWMGMLNDNVGLASQKLDRIEQILKSRKSSHATLETFYTLVGKGNDCDYIRKQSNGVKTTCIPAYDVISLYGIANQVTKSNVSQKSNKGGEK